MLAIADPYAGPGDFHKAQLHVHTTRSDGRLEPEEALARYRDAGFTFVCLTDHDWVTRCDALNGPGFLAVPGVEETIVRGIYPLGPHLGRIFAEAPLGRGTAQERIDATTRDGGIAVLHHPSWKGNLWSAEWTVSGMRALRGSWLLEIVNPHSDTTEDVRRWAAVLRTRSAQDTVGAVAGDDAHTHRQIARGWTMVKVPAVTADALRAAMRGLAFYATTGPMVALGADSGTIWCRGEAAAVRFVDRQVRVRAQMRGPEAAYEADGDEGFIRVEIEDGPGRAWSQPFWIGSEGQSRPTNGGVPK